MIAQESVQALAKEVSKRSVLALEKSSLIALAQQKLRKDGVDTQFLAPAASQVADGALQVVHTLRSVLSDRLLDGDFINPLELSGQYEYIMSLPKHIPEGDLPLRRDNEENRKVLLRNAIERSKNFSVLPSYQSQRTNMATMFHQLGLFAPRGYEAVVSMETNPDLRSNPGTAMLIPETFQVSWQPIEAAAAPIPLQPLPDTL